MAEPLVFEVWGRPVPFQHMTQRSKYLPKHDRCHEYHERVRSCSMGALLDYGRKRWDHNGPFALRVEVFITETKPGRGRREDLTNWLKAIEDGIAKPVLKDDSYTFIRRIEARVRFVGAGQEHVLVTLTPLQEEADGSEEEGQGQEADRAPDHGGARRVRGAHGGGEAAAP